MGIQFQSSVIGARWSAEHSISPTGSRRVASLLFRKLIANVNRHRLATDRAYYALVSAITELLSDDEVAILALYLAPQLAAAASLRPARMASQAVPSRGMDGRA
ncbi:MAG: hypothetical protein ACREEL_14340 [Stellaceae bacterium]